MVIVRVVVVVRVIVRVLMWVRVIVTNRLRLAEPPEMTMWALEGVEVNEFAVAVHHARSGHAGLRRTTRRDAAGSCCERRADDCDHVGGDARPARVAADGRHRSVLAVLGDSHPDPTASDLLHPGTVAARRTHENQDSTVGIYSYAVGSYLHRSRYPRPRDRSWCRQWRQHWGQVLGTGSGAQGRSGTLKATRQRGPPRRIEPGKTRREARLLRPADDHVNLHGKEGVNGSSPLEGSKSPAICWVFVPRLLDRVSPPCRGRSLSESVRGLCSYWVEPGATRQADPPEVVV